MRTQKLFRIAALALMLEGRGRRGKPIRINVGTAADLTAAVNAGVYQLASERDGAHDDQPDRRHHGTAQMIVNANVVINGGGYTLNMNDADRAFFIAGGNVANQQPDDRQWPCKGRGWWRCHGRGGAGLGGAIFCGQRHVCGVGRDRGGLGYQRASGDAARVSFTANTAAGGSGGYYKGGVSDYQSGGGGMGGNGGAGANSELEAGAAEADSG